MTPWTVARQAPLSMGFSSKDTGVVCHFLLQGIFLTQGSNPDLLHCRQILYRLTTTQQSRGQITNSKDSEAKPKVVAVLSHKIVFVLRKCATQ